MTDSTVTPDVSLRRFADASWWLLRALTHDEIIDGLVSSARALSGADVVFFAAREGEELRIGSCSGLSSPELARSWRLPVGEGAVGSVVARGKSALVTACDREARRVAAMEPFVEAEGIRSAAVLPVLGVTGVTGALCLMHRSVVAPDQWPMEPLELLVRQAVSLDIVVSTELGRLAERAADATALAARRLQDLPGLVARAFTSEGGLDAGLRVMAERLEVSLLLVGADGVSLGRAAPSEAVSTEPEVMPTQGEIGIELGGGLLARLQVRRPRPLRAGERRAICQCGSVIALQLRREQSAVETEERLGCALFRQLLNADVADEGALRHRAALLGVNLTAPRILLRVGRQGTGERHEGHCPLREPDLRLLMTQARSLAEGAVGWITGSDVMLVLDVPGLSEADLRVLVAKLLKGASPRLRPSLGVGVGRLCRTISDYPRAATEAGMGLAIARCRRAPNEIVMPADLGFCSVLAASSDETELINLVSRALEPLLGSDARHGTEYVRTLKAFHDCDRHVASAAERLDVHVNTLRHRLRKIEDLLGADLADADTRFMVELALRVHEALRVRAAV